MKVLTLTQPWATLVAIGAKRIETRSWSTKYRGPLAIHAAKGFPAWAKDMCGSLLVTGLLGWPTCPKPLTQEWIDDNSRRIKALPFVCIDNFEHLDSQMRDAVLAACRKYAEDEGMQFILCAVSDEPELKVVEA